MSKGAFFDEQMEQSRIKAEIVTKYFWAWAKVIVPAARRQSGRIGYIDLFAGPGRYKDGSKSTPILLLERAVQDPDMREMLVTLFNDANADYTRSLEQAIREIAGIATLKHQPEVRNGEVGLEIVRAFEKGHLIPTLFFVDPWGYKGLSLRLINSVLKDWGCDCIIFFNYNRINMGINNAAVKQHMDALFGGQRADELTAQLAPMLPDERELTIVEAIAEALQEMGGRYVLPFRFRSATGARTSHHLVFVTKHVRGYEIMKEIMAKESSSSEQGVASFEYSPASEKQPVLFQLSRSLDDLAGDLLGRFAGCALTMREVYEQHQVGTPYIKSNYKEALKNLELAGKITAVPPAKERRKRNGEPTFADGVLVAFPPKGG